MQKMAQIQYDDVADALVEAVPALRACYEEERRQWGDEPPGTHMIFGDILNPYLLDLLRAGRQEDTLRKIFQFLECLVNHEDVHVQELVAITVCVRLGDAPAALHTAHKYMGARTRQFSEEVEAFWGRTAQMGKAPHPNPLPEGEGGMQGTV